MMESKKHPHVELSRGYFKVRWGGSSMDVRPEHAGAFASLLKGVSLMEGGAEVAPRHLVTTSPPLEDQTKPPSEEKKRRKSRKNVGDALVVWMSAHPGWHSEEDLLRTVIAHRMTDAEPKRALKIALGRKKDETFVTDGLGNWQLMEDVIQKVPYGIGEGSGGSDDDESGSRWDASTAREIALARKNLLGE